MLVVIQLVIGDDAGLLPGVEFADLLQGQQVVDGAGRIVHHILLGQGVCFHDAAGDHDGAHVLQAADAHQHGRNGLVAAGDEHAAVVHAGVGLCFHQIDHCFPVGQGIIDAVMSLRDAIAHIGGKVPCGLAAVGVDRLHSLPDELVQMGAAGVAVTEGALHQDLGLCQILDLPAHTDLQGIVFRGQLADFLRTEFHKIYLHTLFSRFARRPFSVGHLTGSL